MGNRETGAAGKTISREGGVVVPEVVVGWAARRPGSPLDCLARALMEWLGAMDPIEAMLALAEGAGIPLSPRQRSGDP